MASQGEPCNLVNGAGVDLGRRWAAVLGALWQLGRGEVHPLLREEKRLATSLREAILAQVLLLFFLALVTGPRRSLSLKLSETRVYEPQIRAQVLPPTSPQS